MAISLIKKTLGKNGKYYYYESLSEVDHAKDVYWYKTDEFAYNHCLDLYKTTASKIDLNENGEVVYMEYMRTANSSLPKKEKKGCFMTIIIIAATVTTILLAY